MDKWLRNNNVVKAVAVLIGVLLWIIVRLDMQTTGVVSSSDVRTDTINNAMVAAINYDTNVYSVALMEPSEVTVILKGKTSTLRRLNPSSYKVEVDLSKYEAGTHMVPVRANNIPSSVSVEIFPQTLRVQLEEKQKKEVPVVIQVTGLPATGYKAGQPIIKPNRVNVTVPKSRLDTVDVVRGEINVDKATTAVTKQVKLSVFDKNGKEIDGGINPQIVEVEVPITSPFKLMPLQVKLIGQPSPGFAIASMVQKPDQVTVYGPQDLIDKLDFYSATGLQVDVSGWRADRSTTLDVPLNNRVTLVDPTKVEVTFTVVPSVSRVIDNIPITFVGQNDGAVNKILPPSSNTLSVSLEGAPVLLDKLKLQDIQAIVDVSNLPPGRHEVTVQVNLPPFIKKSSQSMAQVTVEIGQGTSKSPSPSSAR